MWPLITVISAGLGAWVGVRVAVTRLEVEMKGALSQLTRHEREIAQHNDDLLVHDMELEQALNKLELKRHRRQALRGWDKL